MTGIPDFTFDFPCAICYKLTCQSKFSIKTDYIFVEIRRNPTILTINSLIVTNFILLS